MLGVFVIGTLGLADYAAAVQPTVLLYLDPSQNNVKAALTIGRKYYDLGAQAWLLSDPQAGGEQLAREQIAAARVTGIDTWMGINEPPVDNPDKIARLCQLERTRTMMLNAAGLCAVTLSLSVGWPQEDMATRTLMVDGYRPFLDWLPPNNFVGLHEYWSCAGPLAAANYDPLYPSKVWRFRHWDFDKPIIITECGVDHSGQPSDGWKSCGFSAATYAGQLVDYAALVCQDERVRGIVVFQWGGGGWPSFDVAGHWREMMDAWNYAPPVMPVAQPVRVLSDGKVHTLPLEEYLRAVVPAEMPALWPMDALKAQAVWARSYALWRVANPQAASFDLYGDARDQVWNTAKVHARSDQAVSETAGMALVRNGVAFDARYISRCGRYDCLSCQGVGGYEDKTWSGRACQWGAKALADADEPWQDIAVSYYGADVTLVDLNAEEPTGGGDQPPGGTEPMWDTRLNAYSEANGKVTGVKCIIEPHDTIRTRFGNPVLPVGGWYWKCTSGVFFDEDQAGNLHDITVSMVDENGAPFPGAVWHAYPTVKMAASNWATAFDNGGGPGQVFPYPTGSGSIAMGANDFKPKEGQIGPYIVGVYSPAETGGVISSELVFGMGMPYSRHVRFAFVFQRTKLGTTPEPTPGGTGCNLATAISAFFDALKGA